MKLTLNGQEQVLEGVDPGMPLLWAIRDMAGRDAGHRSPNIGPGDAFFALVDAAWDSVELIYIVDITYHD